MPLPNVEPNMDRIQLEQAKFSLRQFIADELHLNNLDLNTYIEDYAAGVVYEFRTHIWSHKLPPETKVAEYLREVPVFNSAWQLWKHNHQYSRWFGWVAKRWPPAKRGIELIQATVSFDLSKRTLFPDYNYPAGLGTPYHHVVASEPLWKWTND